MKLQLHSNGSSDFKRFRTETASQLMSHVWVLASAEKISPVPKRPKLQTNSLQRVYVEENISN
jgi:hypothetical protein